MIDLIIQMPLVALLCMLFAAALTGIIIGRISTSKPATATFDIPTPKLALILYEATRAYRRANGIIVDKTWNNLPVLSRRGMVNNLAAFRRRPYVPAPTEPFEKHLQAAIVALAD